MAELFSELERFQEILTDVKLLTENFPDATFSEGLYECVQGSASKITDINNLVASNPFKLSKLNDENHARVVWVRYRQTLLTMREDLHVLRVDLAVRLGLIKAYVGLKRYLFTIGGGERYCQMLITSADSRLVV